ncbi:MAG TPA: thiamine-phosphate kinase [Acetobacteraceae bacterium]|nr:thiamine-phosphate kinase [Acetobacteraceae bacterium]
MTLSLPAEFGLIGRYFAPLAGPEGLGLQDDAALFTPPAGRELVITKDAMVAGVHFIGDEPADLIARKLLRSNLSDLAAMGATPLHYLLALAVSRGTDEAWFAAFAKGLAQDQAHFNITLLGGDTVSTTGPLCVSATLIGHVTPGHALRRTGACVGDGLYVTGTIGDAALGLRALRGDIIDADGYLVSRYRLPQPRLGLALHGIAHAAMDISDGLLQDLGHLCRASALGARIDAALVPVSIPGQIETCLTGGDDYELLLAVPPARHVDLQKACAGLRITKIGEFVAGERITVCDIEGAPMTFSRAGWSHF